MFRIVRFTQHCHCHHCYYHFQKCLSVSNSSSSLPAKQLSSNSIPTCNVFLQQVLRIVVGKMLVVILVVGVGVFLLYVEDSA